MPSLEELRASLRAGNGLEKACEPVAINPLEQRSMRYGYRTNKLSIERAFTSILEVNDHNNPFLTIELWEGSKLRATTESDAGDIDDLIELFTGWSRLAVSEQRELAKGMIEELARASIPPGKGFDGIKVSAHPARAAVGQMMTLISACASRYIIRVHENLSSMVE